MNDFTKEQLEELLIWSNYLAGCNPELIKKLQSMFDNYCEQECPSCGRKIIDVD